MTIRILGNGITAKSVQRYSEKMGYHIVTEGADKTIISPGIDPKSMSPISGLISEIEFAYREIQKRAIHQRTRIIGVTGTNGKSTVVTLIGRLIQAPTVGNIGDPLINYVDTKEPWVVCELSSFQLEHCDQFRPDIGVFLNVQADHLDRHHTMDAYSQVKAQLFQAQGSRDVLIYNADDNRVQQLCQHAVARRIPIQAHPPHAFHHSLPGVHQDMAVKIATTVATQLGVSDADIQNRLTHFQGLPHRLEYIRTIHHCPIYNDSKATNPAATIAAINAFDKPIILVLCGQPKTVDYSPLVACICNRVKLTIVFGAMTTAIQAHFLNKKDTVYYVETMGDAITKALKESGPHDVILFSPGGSSHDQFRNFEHRGDAFKHIVSVQ